MLVSVVIRSYRRPEALKELIAALRTQDHPDFEIVVLEQSEDPRLIEDLRALGESRLRVVVSAPLGPPAARNAAIRHARGDVLLFVDDDDLPVGDAFISAHARQYDDPTVMGVVGRLVTHPDRVGDEPRFPRLVRHFAMKRSFFWDTRGLWYNTLRKENADFLIGSNASVRKSLVERIGGWDEGISMNEEQSFSIRFEKMRRDGERFVFDPSPVLWRRTDVPGGLSRRAREDWYGWELDARLFYYRHVVGYYYPLRYHALAPLFWLRAATLVAAWVWDPDNARRPVSDRIAATLGVFAKLPRTLRRSRFSPQSIRRMERWG
jgi:glycosyltransferase involved in cell wall biosynthesis